MLFQCKNKQGLKIQKHHGLVSRPTTKIPTLYHTIVYSLYFLVYFKKKLQNFKNYKKLGGTKLIPLLVGGIFLKGFQLGMEKESYFFFLELI